MWVMESPIVNLRIPAELLDRLKRQADKEPRSLSSLIVAMFQQALPASEWRVS
jgi:CopG antitoxin of type II toxin-antitoxin system